MLAFLQVTEVRSQKKILDQANKLFNSYAYVEAKDLYKKALKVNKNSSAIGILKRIGDCYYYNSNLEDAAYWYQRLWHKKSQKDSILKQKTENDQVLSPIEIQEAEVEPEYYFRTAQVLRHLKKYQLADKYIMLLKETGSEDTRIQKLIDNPGYLKNILTQSGRHRIQLIPQNSRGVDFAPSFYKNKIIFSSSRVNKITRVRNKWTNQPYLDLYRFKLRDHDSIFSYPFKFSKNINSVLHESTSAFTKDGATVYFTRNNLTKSKIKKDSAGVSRLKIYKSTYTSKKEWSEPEELPFNNNEYSVAHPALDSSGTKMYFASDMPGGYGMSDLYVVDINPNGSFGTPKNLGPTINTEGRDTFPFMTDSGMLYFASDGHLGLGGFDLFLTRLDSEDFGVYNLGEPVNSISDDITLIFDEKLNRGYFASNRPGGRGEDDIYGFTEVKPFTKNCMGHIRAMIINEETGALITNANIEIKNQNGEVTFSGVTDIEGSYYTDLECSTDQKYTVVVKKADYEDLIFDITISPENNTFDEELKMKNAVPSQPKIAAGIDLAKLLNLNPIYFASNKYNILPKSAIELDKVVAFLKENEDIRIEIGSHTDSKGSDQYNLKLSQNRAASTGKYIISKGIKAERVLNKGYGESTLINKCKNGVPCSKQEHAMNRRSEFIVLE